MKNFAKSTVAASLCLLLPGFALAENAAFSSDSRWATGDWGGVRTGWLDKGIDVQLSYTGEMAANAHGGYDKDHTARWTEQYGLGLNADLQKLLGWEHSQFQLTITERDGRNLTNDRIADPRVGGYSSSQEVYGRGQTWHLTQLWLNQTLLDERLEVKLGRMTVGEDFASFSCDFQNLSFCGAQPGNVVGDYWVNWPTSQWAARIKYHTSDNSYLQLGAYQVNPTFINDRYARRSGWKPNNPGGTTGALIPLEAGWQPAWRGLPGSWKVGAWYNTSEGEDLYLDLNRNPRGVTGLAPLQRNGRFGGYLSLQQQVTGRAGGRGATVFLNFTQADRHTSRLDRQLALGVQYQGPFEGRPLDSAGLAIGATHNNGRFADFAGQNDVRTGQDTIAGSGYELVGEVYYAWNPVPSVSLRPNLQLIRHPGGTSRNGNAVVIGLKTIIAF